MFGSMQMAVSRVIRLQHHRIAQVKTQLTIEPDTTSFYWLDL